MMKQKRGTRLVFVLVTILLFSMQPVYASDFTIDLGSIFTETEAGFTVLLYATCVDALGVQHEDNVTFTINSTAFTWNTYTNRYEGTDSSNIPATNTYNNISASNDVNNLTSTFTLNNTVTVTWTQSTMDRLSTNFMGGDWIGAIIDENTRVMGVLFTYTALMAIFSVGIYNVSGFYATVFTWILGWGIFSGVTHGNAQLLGFLFIGLAGGLALVKAFLDRRNS